MRACIKRLELVNYWLESEAITVWGGCQMGTSVPRSRSHLMMFAVPLVSRERAAVLSGLPEIKRALRAGKIAMRGGRIVKELFSMDKVCNRVSIRHSKGRCSI